ncbi:MAG: PspC domain-containing protein [Cytophagaceae bacterium]|nr:MAG: PspC domain-containing protein [Cytophagaceae bacterium]
MKKRLERIADQAQIGGVCAGLADYFGIDRTLVRVLFVIGIFLPHFPAIIIYVILWIALPERRSAGSVLQSTVYANPIFMNPYNPNKPASPDRSLLGGGILILLGVMFLIDRYFDIDFGDLWPFILIAIGLWLIFRDRIRTPFDPNQNDPYKSDPYKNDPTQNDPTNPTSGTL